jgi:divalent metal cation (Fe/Co/Zn/Cd) transporter
LRWALLLASATVLWNIVEGVVAVAAGIRASSIALVGFGVDSFVETASGVVIGWRVLEEMRAASTERAEDAERQASRVAGALLIALAAYILIDAGRRLVGFGQEPTESIVGIVLTAVSLVIMPLLGWAKRRTARRLDSRALRADAYETITCAWLSLTTLAGLGLNATLGWWWADPVAALVMLPLIVREGLEAWKGQGCCDEEAGA